MASYITYSDVTGSVLFWQSISGCFADASGNVSSGEVTGFIEMVSDVITNYIGYFLGATTGLVDSFHGRNKNVHFINRVPLLNVSGITYDQSTDQGAATGAIVGWRWDESGRVELLGSTYPTFWRGVKYKITYYAGYTTIPDDVKLATLMLMQHMALQIFNESPGSDGSTPTGWRFSKYSESQSNSALIYSQYNGLFAGATDLPAPIANILRKYKLAKSVGG